MIQHNTALTRLYPVTIYIDELQQDTNFNKRFVWKVLRIKMKQHGRREEEEENEIIKIKTSKIKRK
jgi:hypothetical protein